MHKNGCNDREEEGECGGEREDRKNPSEKRGGAVRNVETREDALDVH